MPTESTSVHGAVSLRIAASIRSGLSNFFTSLPPPATLKRGHPDNRHPRLRLAVHAAHCAAHPRAECLLRCAAVHGAAQRNPGPQSHRIDPFRRAVVGLRCRRAGRRPARARAGRARRSASATDCTYIVHHLGGKVRSAPKREYGHAEVTIEDSQRRCLPICRRRSRCG